jgi:hypothetical protein
MASIEAAVRYLLQNDPAVGATVGSRIYPEIFPQDGTPPLIVYVLVSDRPQLAHDGNVGLTIANYQYDLWAADHDTALLLGQQFTAALNGYRGTVEGVKIDKIAIENIRGEPDRDLRLSRRIAELSVIYSIV